ncbi:hypothetical protein V5O48_001792 [Marasmius crinis-equi]|uniref:Uncharacterized protein n=1 Tax=Marasmius crinis-equi TaxID=585013 RepID=A0ABR3FXC4_9AGAR
MQSPWESPDFYLANLSLHASHRRLPPPPPSQSFWDSILLSPYFPSSPQSDAGSSSSSEASMTPPLPPPRPPQQALHVICNAPIIAPKPLPYHSPTFLKFELLPDIEEDLSHPPYTQRPSKRKRENCDDADEFVVRKRRSIDVVRPPRPPSVHQHHSMATRRRQPHKSRGETAQLAFHSHSHHATSHLRSYRAHR